MVYYIIIIFWLKFIIYVNSAVQMVMGSVNGHVVSHRHQTANLLWRDEETKCENDTVGFERAE